MTAPQRRAHKLERAAAPFSIGVNYLPRRTAMNMWRNFDRSEIDEDFARIAGLGLDSVRLFLRWDDFQPCADTVDPLMLERFETVLALAISHRLRVMPVLFCGHMSGVNYLPAWALPSDVSSGNIYRGPLLEAQLFFARTIGSRLRAHPAISAWDIGHAFTSVFATSDARVTSGEHSTAPATEMEVAGWSTRLCEALRDSAIPATAGLQAADLLEDRNIRFASLCAPLRFASMQGDSVHCGFARNRRDPEAIPFLALLTAAFSFKPVLITGFGNPTCPAGKFSAFERFALRGESPQLSIAPNDSIFATYPCLTEDENAVYCTAVLERLHTDGRLGAYWWCWADFGAEGRSSAPLGAHSHEATYGIIRADGTEKPVAAALAAFATQRRAIVRARDMPMIAAAYYYRTLPTSTHTLFDAFLGSLDEQRRSP